VPESLPIKLNGESVHAIEAPETFTAAGPFNLELRNDGGAVHVHVHLDDALSRGARLRNVNHYVETGETVRVPVGVVDGDGVTGHLEIVSGYGAERERVEVTVPAAAERDQVGEAADPGPEAAAHGESGVTPSSESDGSGTPTGTATPQTSGDGSEEWSTPETPAAGGTSGVSDSRSSVAGASRTEVAFGVLAAVALVIGIAVILTVREPVLSVVVAGVLTAAVVAAGWLLLD
jgi:hypothetical protein